MDQYLRLRRSDRQNKGIPPERYGINLRQTGKGQGDQSDQSETSETEKMSQTGKEVNKFDEHRLDYFNKMIRKDKFDSSNIKMTSLIEFDPVLHSTRQQVESGATIRKEKTWTNVYKQSNQNNQSLIEFTDDEDNNETIIEKKKSRNGASRSSVSVRDRLKLLEQEKSLKIKQKELELEQEKLRLEREYLDKRIDYESRYGSGSDNSSVHDENFEIESVKKGQIFNWIDDVEKSENGMRDTEKATDTEKTIMDFFKSFTDGIKKAVNDSNGKSDKTVEKDSTIKVKVNKFKDLPYFNGNPEDWPNFIGQFERTTEEYGISSTENINRLEKSLKGKAKEVVKAMLVVPENLPKIIETLRKRFGRADYIIKTIVDKVRLLNGFKEGQHDIFLDFNDAIQNLVVTITNLKELHFLHNPELLKTIVQKLPVNLQFEWARKEKEMEKKDMKAKLDDFACWLEEVADATVRLHTPKIIPLKSKYPQNFNRESVFVHANVDKEVKRRKQRCFCCEDEKHTIVECPEFKAKTVDDRWSQVTEKRLCFSCLKPRHGINECRSQKKCNVDGCPRPHHELLHSLKKKEEKIPEKTQEKSEKDTENVNCSINASRNVLLKILPIWIRGPKKSVKIHAMLDDASTVTLLHEDIAQEVGLQGPVTGLTMKWTNRTTAEDDGSQRVSCYVSDAEKKEEHKICNVRTVKILDLPLQTYNLKSMREKYEKLNDVPLVPPENVKPKMLIGEDNIHVCIPDKTVAGSKNGPYASKTPLGWVLHGKPNARIDDDCEFAFVCQEQEDDLDDIQEFKKLWKDDDESNLEDRKNELLDRSFELLEETSRLIGDRWEIGLLWKEENVQLPNNKEEALRRFKSVENNMKRDPEFAKKYSLQMETYLNKGYAKKLTKEEKGRCHERIWYLPHFSVKNPQKPNKFRFVFDASAKYKGKSLNSELLTGPDLLNGIQPILFKFRQHKIGFCADIEEMFLRIKIKEEDQDALRFLWKDSNGMEEYKMNSMIFGAACSPASAIYVTRKNAKTFESQFPKAVTAIEKQLYMDDYIDSCEDLNEAVDLVNQVIKVHELGGFNMRNWISNSKELLKAIPEDKLQKNIKNVDLATEKSERVLGLTWNYEEDYFAFNLKFARVSSDVLNLSRKPTKREVLATVMSPFDPVGFLTPVTMRGKLIMQKLWKNQGDWDEELPDELVDSWNGYLSEVKNLKVLKIPRLYSELFQRRVKLELHVFCDASFQGYAAVAYFRVILNFKIAVSFVFAKSRVAPMKKINKGSDDETMPRLELRAAHLGTEVASFVVKNHRIEIHSKRYWTDSSITYYRIQSQSSKHGVFVKNRLIKIWQSTNQDEWRWIPSELNSADVATRNTGSVTEFWLNGPEFLKLDEGLWPAEIGKIPLKIPESKSQDLDTEIICTTTVKNEMDLVPNFKDYSSYEKLIEDTLEKDNSPPDDLVLRRKDAEMKLIKMIQNEEFHEEFKLLRKNARIPKLSPLFKLSPFIDQNQIIRMKSRINASPDISEDTKNPIILPNHHITKLIIKDYHEKGYHLGREYTLNKLRNRFFVIHGGALVKKICFECEICREARPKPQIPKMGDLPSFRITGRQPPFTFTGVDYFGPMTVKIGRRNEKRYGVLLTCLVTRAIHLELAHSLDTDSAILAIRRFISRRGEPKYLYSDNGTNFHGSDNEIKALIEQLDYKKIEKTFAVKGITWKFIPPASPHVGGCWERLIGSVKRCLNKTLNNEVLQEETLQTALCEIEYVLNNRPLTHVSVHPEDDLPLTPNDLLLGRKEDVVTLPWSFIEEERIIKKQWKLSQIIADRFWKKWTSEYLPTLAPRSKWHRTPPGPPIQKNDSVIVIDNSLPRNVWIKGKIEKTYPGKDNIIRFVDVKTVTGILKRPITKVAVIARGECSGTEEKNNVEDRLWSACK